jgi:hypothetical protein
MRLRLSICALAVSTLLVAAPPVLAQGDEVFVEPDSPTGREYAIPLERARRDASTAEPSHDYRARTAPLFGEGIGEDPATGEGGEGSHGAPSRPGKRSSRANGTRSAGGRPGHGGLPPAVQAAIEQPAAPSGGLGMVALVGAASGLVMMVGIAAGLVLRRRAKH